MIGYYWELSWWYSVIGARNMANKHHAFFHCILEYCRRKHTCTWFKGQKTVSWTCRYGCKNIQSIKTNHAINNNRISPECSGKEHLGGSKPSHNVVKFITPEQFEKDSAGMMSKYLVKEGIKDHEGKTIIVHYIKKV